MLLKGFKLDHRALEREFTRVISVGQWPVTIFQTSLADGAVTEKVTAGPPLFKRSPRRSLGCAASSGLVKQRSAKPAQRGEEVRVAR